MDTSGVGSPKEAHVSVDMTTEDEYVCQSKLLKDFINICEIDKAWIFKSENGRILIFP